MTMSKRQFFVFACVIGLFACAAPALSRADSLVIDSNSRSFKHGDVLVDSAHIRLQESDWLRLEDQTTGDTSTLKGPYEGTVANYRGDCPIYSRILGRCREIPVRDPIGGTREPR
jgi:hypothetical protein